MATVVGVPKEIKDMEGRVSMQPDGVTELVHHGHEVVVQSGAGGGAGFTDEEYERWTRLSAHFARTAGLRPAPYQRQRQMDGEWLRVKAAQDRTGHQFGCDCPACVPTDNQQMEAA